MKIVLMSKRSLDIEQYVELEMSVLISPSKSLINLHWVTFLLKCVDLHTIGIVWCLFYFSGWCWEPEK